MTFSPDGKVLAAIGDEDQLVSFDVATGKELKELTAVRAAASPLVFSPDGGTLTTIDGEQTLHFWDRSTGKDRLATPDSHRDSVGFLAFIHAGKTLVSTSRDHTMRFWNLATGQPIKSLPHDGTLRSVAIRADGTPLALGLDASWTKALVWNLETGAPLQAWSTSDAEQESAFRNITLSRDACSVTVVLQDIRLRSWDVATGKERAIAQPKRPVRQAQDLNDTSQSLVASDGRTLVLTSDEGLIQVYDIPSGNLRFETSAMIREPDFRDPAIRSYTPVEFAPDGLSLAFVRQVYKQVKRADGETRVEWPRESTIVWLDSQTGHVRREIVIPESDVGPLAFSPDGQLIATAASSSEQDKAIRIFRLRDKKQIQIVETNSPQVSALSFTPGGTQIAAGLTDTTIVLWSLRPRD